MRIGMIPSTSPIDLQVPITFSRINRFYYFRFDKSVDTDFFLALVAVSKLKIVGTVFECHSGKCVLFGFSDYHRAN